VYLSGLESLLTNTAQAMLNTKATQYPQTGTGRYRSTRSKNLALDLLLAGGLETDLLLERLTALFLTKPCLERRDRNPPRKKSSSRGLLNFHKRQKKHCF
jgi:hypothetical protein